MLDVLTAEDVRRQDAACHARGIPTSVLMENAGFCVARGVRELLGVTYGMRVVIVCGKGNNAGDGLVAGRVLASWGAHATAVMSLGRELSGAAGDSLRRFRGRVVGPESLERELARADVVVDALFGVGLSRPPEGEAARAISAIAAAPVPVVAVDVPSGMDADTGRILGEVPPRADVIVTLGGLKPGLAFAADVAARVEVADIGVPADLRSGSAVALERHDVAAALPTRTPGTNKRRVGTVLVVAGSRAMPGAAALVAGACVHSGAGLTMLAAPETVVQVVLPRVPEVTTIPLPETSEGAFDEKALEQVRARLPEFHAIAVGPGLSTHPATREAVRALVQETSAPLVLDADGITAFAGATSVLHERDGFTLLTPHAGELSRLTGASADDIQADRLGAARRAAASFGCAVLLKGPGSIVCGPDGTLYLNLTGNRGLAQGGTGDVLTGILASVSAQTSMAGGDLLRAAAAGAWLHGTAADLAAERFAPHPASASLLIELLPEAIHRVFS
jgi:NAD(P)H-hydrate epimerase